MIDEKLIQFYSMATPVPWQPVDYTRTGIQFHLYGSTKQICSGGDFPEVFIRLINNYDRRANAEDGNFLTMGNESVTRTLPGASL